MVNSQQVKETIQALKLDINVDRIPPAAPTIETNPKQVKEAHICRSAQLAAAATATIYTTPIDQDFYLTSGNISMKCTSGTTVTYMRITAFINSVAYPIIEISSIAGQATTAQNTLALRNPIKIDRGTAITIDASAADAAGTTRGAACIQGFIDEIN